MFTSCLFLTVAGLDYNIGGTTLYFGPSDYQLCFTLTFLDDGLVEGNETFHLFLDSVDTSVNYSYIGLTEATIVILGNVGTFFIIY